MFPRCLTSNATPRDVLIRPEGTDLRDLPEAELRLGRDRGDGWAVPPARVHRLRHLRGSDQRELLSPWSMPMQSLLLLSLAGGGGVSDGGGGGGGKGLSADRLGFRVAGLQGQMPCRAGL